MLLYCWRFCFSLWWDLPVIYFVCNWIIQKNWLKTFTVKHYNLKKFKAWCFYFAFVINMSYCISCVSFVSPIPLSFFSLYFVLPPSLFSRRFSNDVFLMFSFSLLFQLSVSFNLPEFSLLPFRSIFLFSVLFLFLYIFFLLFPHVSGSLFFTYNFSTSDENSHWFCHRLLKSLTEN